MERKRTHNLVEMVKEWIEDTKKHKKLLEDFEKLLLKEKEKIDKLQQKKNSSTN